MLKLTLTLTLTQIWRYGHLCGHREGAGTALTMTLTLTHLRLYQSVQHYKRDPLMPLKVNAMSMGAAVAATLPPTPPRGGGPGRTRTAMEANIVVQHKEAGGDFGGTHGYLAGQDRHNDPTPSSYPPITYSDSTGSDTEGVSRGLG